MSDEKKWISRVEFAEGRTAHGTKVILSDGSELAGVIAVEQRASVDDCQEITVRVLKGEAGPSAS